MCVSGTVLWWQVCDTGESGMEQGVGGDAAAMQGGHRWQQGHH